MHIEGGEKLMRFDEGSLNLCNIYLFIMSCLMGVANEPLELDV
jgi:hypothetical protein